jgi:hypothetical protein
MSHEATTWAIRQRGLKPTTKIVLWHLCDRFNPDYGCFPSQDRLARDCEISRSTLNAHLALLERAGLLRRVPRVHPVTRRQMSTRYVLGFEPGFAPEDPDLSPDPGHGDRDVSAPSAETGETTVEASTAPVPCPETGHGSDARAVSDSEPQPCPKNAPYRVRKPDTNLVREPLREPVKEAGAQARTDLSEAFFAELLRALGLDPAVLPAWWQGRPPRAHVRRWRDELGLDEESILAVAAATRRERPEPPDGPGALDRAMQRAARRLKRSGRASAEKGTVTGNGVGRAKDRRRRYEHAPRPSADALAAFYAELVNSDRYLPVSAISNTLRDAMLARGLVTAERLRARGVR